MDEERRKKLRLAWRTFKDVFSFSGKEVRQYTVMMVVAMILYGSYQMGWRYIPLGIVVVVAVLFIARVTGFIDEEPEFPMM